MHRAIVNGQADSAAHDAVVLLFNNYSYCTGTIIKRDVTTGVGYVLSAAHCHGPFDWARQQRDRLSPEKRDYKAVRTTNHPLFDEDSVSSSHDFSVIKIKGVDADTPVINPMGFAEDRLAIGVPLVSIGYGQTSRIGEPIQNEATRQFAVTPIIDVSPDEFRMDERAGGPCAGDSGGPGLATVNGEARLASVHAYVIGPCDDTVVSDRVSSVEDWLVETIGDGPDAGAPTTCEDCARLARWKSGTCGVHEQACSDDGDCLALSQCLLICAGDSVCEDDCRAASPEGVAAYERAAGCVCEEACTALCGATPPCVARAARQPPAAPPAATPAVEHGCAAVATPPDQWLWLLLLLGLLNRLRKRVRT